MRAARLIGILSAALCVRTVVAGPVSVNVTAAGAAADSVVLVFDPLDVAPAATHDTAIIDQVDKRFVPRISVVRTGTAATFPNSDHIRHQVYSFSAPKRFTLKLYAGSPPSGVVFDKPGLVVLGCNIHDQMVGFVAVVDSPYFAKTDAAGAASLNLPAGRYRLRVWHPSLAAPAPVQEITVPVKALSLPLAITLLSDPSEVAAWPE